MERVWFRIALWSVLRRPLGAEGMGVVFSEEGLGREDTH